MGILSHHVPNLALTGKGERTHGAHKFQNLVKIAALADFSPLRCNNINLSWQNLARKHRSRDYFSTPNLSPTGEDWGPQNYKIFVKNFSRHFTHGGNSTY